MMRALGLGCLVACAQGHATLTQPLSRGMYRNKKGPCGPNQGAGIGCYEPWSAGGTGGYSPCGISRGEDFTEQPWETEKLSNAEVKQHTLHAGGTVELKVLFNAHHLGHVIYGLCPDSDLAGPGSYGDPTTGTPPKATPDCSTLSGAE